MTANLPVLSFVVTRTVEMLSWSSISSNRSPERPNGQKRWSQSKFYKRKLHDNLKTESETEFGGLRGTQSSEGRPTIRHDVEYGSADGVEVQQTGLGKYH